MKLQLAYSISFKKMIGIVSLGVILIFFYSLSKYTPLRSFHPSKNYDRYLKVPQQELSKLLLVFDHFKNTSFKVIYEGREYDINLALLKAKQFLRTHYKNEKADQWVQVNLYRSQSKGEIIYLKYPDGKVRPLRDVLIEELHFLQSAAR